LQLKRTLPLPPTHQALNAILFLYREVLNMEMGDIGDYLRAKRPKRLPTVLTKEEVQKVMTRLSGVERLVIQLLYGSGLRLREAMQLRIKDLDFPQYQIDISKKQIMRHSR